MFASGLFFSIVVGIALFQNSSANYLTADDLGTVIFSSLLFRHGDRTPVDPYPNDPYRNESSWPVPFGQLTNLGRHQHLMLGRWLRNRYSKLLPETYTYYDIFVRSTDVDRTLMSAESNLAGLYPPEGKQVWDNLKWMPIPVHTVPEKEDHILYARKYCPRYEYELEKLMNSDEMKKINQENAQVYAYLTLHTGRKINTLEDVNTIYNTLFIEELYNKTLPAWTKAVYPDKLKPIAEMSFETDCYNKILKRLKTGSLLGEMVQNLLMKSKNSLNPDRKLWIYSAHDETVANFLMTLDLFDAHCPPYAALVLLELRVNSKNQHIVTISYKNSSAEPTLLTLPGCVPGCPLKQFVKLTKDLIPENWEEECLIRVLRNEFLSPKGVIVMLTSSVLMLIILLILFVGLVYGYHRRKYDQYYLRLTTEPM
ncbi:prostatic acid phosphatase-like [Leptopilina heterotoma]|uniref:prostatic acid phosphatase-like n=1 Tax=Leptopilina heterotoma TaxID=63436 RepID=UPI001CA80CF4|nr:prostatic acid phosphatase-like [Leptopilina heterotoma]